MSLRWIHENLEAPTCDEECSDIDDSCSDDSYDTDPPPALLTSGTAADKDIGEDLNEDDEEHRQKRETRRHPITTVTFDQDGIPRNILSESNEPPSCVIWDPRKPTENSICDSIAVKLFCRTGHHLVITASGQARGFNDGNDPFSLLRIIPVSFGIVRIQNVETGLFLAFNKKGHLYGERRGNKDNTEWEEWRIGNYDTFRSRKYVHEGWWVGIKKNGRTKSGPKTSWGQKAIQFLVVKQD